jgi:hypothetical protein
LMCAEELTTLLNNYTWSFVDHGIKVCHREQWITHLLFVDASLIFIYSCTQGAARLNTILKMYNEALG